MKRLCAVQRMAGHAAPGHGSLRERVKVGNAPKMAATIDA